MTQVKEETQASHYQKAVFDHFAARAGNAAVVAVAGSGKTWTAIESIGHLPMGTNVLLGAFNTAIRDEFKARGEAKGYKGVSYATYNSFGWGICLRNLKKKPELDKKKTANVLEFTIMRPRDDDGYRLLKMYTPPIERLVSLFKSLAIMDPQTAFNEFDDIVDHHNMDVPTSTEFKQCAIDTFTACIEHQAHYDFDDQKYMPLYLMMPIPVFDQVMLDEYQDACPIEMLLMSAAAEGGQFAAFGDPDQCIYGFKSADPARSEAFLKRLKARQLPLSICYRCPTAVIDEAKKIVPRIEAAPGAKRGYVGEETYDKILGKVGAKDFMLCRTTDELVKTQIKLTQMGKKSKVRGRDFGTALDGIIKRVSGNNNQMVVADFITALIAYQFERIEQLTSLRRENEIVNLEDRVNSIKALADQCFRVADINDRLKTVFTDTPMPDAVDLMTCHKSKGLQAKNVFVLRPDLLPHPRSKAREWMAAEEQRLKYVTITRAEELLEYAI